MWGLLWNASCWEGRTLRKGAVLYGERIGNKTPASSTIMRLESHFNIQCSLSKHLIHVGSSKGLRLTLCLYRYHYFTHSTAGNSLPPLWQCTVICLAALWILCSHRLHSHSLHICAVEWNPQLVPTLLYYVVWNANTHQKNVALLGRAMQSWFHIWLWNLLSEALCQVCVCIYVWSMHLCAPISPMSRYFCLGRGLLSCWWREHPFSQMPLFCGLNHICGRGHENKWKSHCCSLQPSAFSYPPIIIFHYQSSLLALASYYSSVSRDHPHCMFLWL